MGGFLMQFPAGSFKTNTVHVIICFIGGLSCLLPLFIYPTSEVENTPIREALSTETNRDFAVATISLMLPLLLDLATEILTTLCKGPNLGTSKIVEASSLLNSIERAAVLFGTAIVPATTFFADKTGNRALVHICCQKCQLTLVGGAVIISLCRYNEKYWSVRSTYFSLACLVSGFVILSFQSNVDPEHTPLENFIVTQVAYTTVLMAALTFFCCSSKWLYSIFPLLFEQFKTSSFQRIDKKQEVSSTFGDLIYPVLYVLLSIASLGILIMLSAIYWSISSFDTNALYIHNISYLIFILFISFVSIRMMKHEVVQGLYALIESKKMYVRYISHELRTPLNSAFLGLKLLSDDLEASNDARDNDRCEILDDVKAACRTSVEILNDLLCFDKLESGILEIHKHDVLIKPFLTDCVDMFSSQAREGGVTMTIITSDSFSDEEGMDLTQIQGPILDSDTCHMDRFKMDQVLRNLLSNALKFTPSGGCVYVSASFIPDKIQPISHVHTIQEMVVKTVSPFSFYLCLSSLISALLLCLSPCGVARPDLINNLDRMESGERERISTDGASGRSDKDEGDSKGLDSSSIESNVSNNNMSSDEEEVENGEGNEKDRKSTYDNILTSGGRQGRSIKANHDVFSMDYLQCSERRGINRNIGSQNMSDSPNIRSTLRGTVPTPSMLRDGSVNLSNYSSPNIGNSQSNSNQSSAKGKSKSDHSFSCKKIPPHSPAGETEEIIHGKLQITVTDTGAGISQVNLQRLFKEIVQFNPEVLQAGGGSGLGLWITNSIVTMHNGTVRAYSAGAGTGCSFTVEMDMQRKCSTRRMPADQSITNPQSPHHSELTQATPHTHAQAHTRKKCNEGEHSQMGGVQEKEVMSEATSLDVGAGRPGFGIGTRAGVGTRVRSECDEPSLGRYPSDSACSNPHGGYRAENGGEAGGVDGGQREGDGEQGRGGGGLGLSPITLDPHLVTKRLFEEIDAAGTLRKSVPAILPTTPPLYCVSVPHPPAERDWTPKQTPKSPKSISKTSLKSSKMTPKRLKDGPANPDPGPVYDVLIVDDSSLNRKMLKKLFLSSGYTCDEAKDGLCAVNTVMERMGWTANTPGYVVGGKGAFWTDVLMCNEDGEKSPKSMFGGSFAGSLGESTTRGRTNEGGSGGGTDVSVTVDGSIGGGGGVGGAEGGDGPGAGAGGGVYDVILMDFIMPNMDGPTATEKLRSMGYKGMIFGVTGNSLDSDINYFIGKGANAVMSKPFDPVIFQSLMLSMHKAKD